LQLPPGFREQLASGMANAVRPLAGADGEVVRTLPGMLAEQGGCDGFFIARLVRRG